MFLGHLNGDAVLDSVVTLHQWKLKQPIGSLFVAAPYNARARPAYNASKYGENES